MEASKCEIEVEHVKNWHLTHDNKPGQLDISRIAAVKLELEKGHFATVTETAAVTEGGHFQEEGGWSKEMSFGNCKRKVDLESTADKNDTNKQQV